MSFEVGLFYATIVIIPLVGITALYLKFGTGLITRLFGRIAVAVVMVAGAEFYVGMRQGDMTTHAVVMSTAAPVVVYIFFSIYRDAVTQIDKLSAELVSHASQLTATAELTAGAANRQAATATQLGAAIAELEQTSQAAARAAEEVERDGDTALERGSEGAHAVRRAGDVLDVLDQVAAIAKMVDELADQSSFLAVNAGIAAAKAGDRGRGFAVVAREVRSLAERSKQAAERIAGALERADEGREALGVVNDVVDGLAAGLDETSDRARLISAATSQQAAGLRQIADAMESMTDASQSVAGAAGQLEDAVAALQERAQQARRTVTGAA